VSAPKNHKQPTFNQSVQTAKTAKAAVDPDAYLDRQPTWRMGMLELCDPYGWHELNLTGVSKIQERLKAFESMTWREILFPHNTTHRPHHPMPVSKICVKAQARLLTIAPDVDELMSLRISQACRVWGIMNQEVCELIFWDPEHQLYPINLTDN